MRIIERGENPKDKPIQKRCRNCKTLTEVTRADLKSSYDPRDQVDSPYFDCPVCQALVYV